MTLMLAAREVSMPAATLMVAVRMAWAARMSWLQHFSDVFGKTMYSMRVLLSFRTAPYFVSQR
uniref:Uncharacterized protein n=1 Tax=Arundo donax TaxID=35708 RepID=A0A0A8XRX6_ARUDO